MDNDAQEIVGAYKLLAQLYPTIGESRRVVVSAGLDSSRIAFETQAVTNWFNIVSESQNQGKISDLLNVATEEFPDRGEIRDLIKQLESTLDKKEVNSEFSNDVDKQTTVSYGNLSYEEEVQDRDVQELDLVYRLKNHVSRITECSVMELPNATEDRLTTFIIDTDAHSIAQVQQKLYQGLNVIATSGTNSIELDCTIPTNLSAIASVGSETSQLFRILLRQPDDIRSTENENSSSVIDHTSNNALILPSSDGNLLPNRTIPKSREDTVVRSHYVIIIHGIRTQAEYQTKLAHELEQDRSIKAITLGYEFFDVVRFLTIGRNKPIKKITADIRDVKTMDPAPEKISIIAHSFGTYIVSKILERHTDIDFHRIIFCGSIVPATFRWDRFKNRFQTPVLNDCGMLDIWPVFAKFATWGYGPTGRFGFKSNRVRDRFHRFKHSDFFEGNFFNNYWRPFLADGIVVEGELKRIKTPWWVSMLTFFKAPILLAAIVFFVFWRFTGATEPNMDGGETPLSEDTATRKEDDKDSDNVTKAEGDIDPSKMTTSANSTPVARRDFIQTDQQTPVQGSLFLANFKGADFDPDGDAISVYSVQGDIGNVGRSIVLDSGSTIEVKKNGDFYFDPTNGFEFLTTGSSSADGVTYSIIDSKGGMSNEVLSMFSVKYRKE